VTSSAKGTVTRTSEHTAVAMLTDGEEVTLYRGNMQRHQRRPEWDWGTVSIGTVVRGTIVQPDRTGMRRRLIEIQIVEP
jgi:hypothetical protein